MSTVRKYISRE